MSMSDAFNDPEAIAMAERVRATSAPERNALDFCLDHLAMHRSDVEEAIRKDARRVLAGMRAERTALRASHALLCQWGEALQAEAYADNKLMLSARESARKAGRACEEHALSLAASSPAQAQAVGK